jgi:hypothetical protein
MQVMPKRPHGTGHVYVKWGAFYGRWRGPQGRLLNRRIGTVRERGSAEGISRREAERALRKLIEAEASRPPAVLDATPRTVDDAVNALRERLALEGARRSYEQNCESTQRIHISPALGSRQLGSVVREDIARLALGMLRRGLAPKTIANVMRFLHQALALAAERGWTQANPVVGAARPRRRRHGAANPDIQFLTLEEGADPETIEIAWLICRADVFEFDLVLARAPERGGRHTAWRVGRPPGCAGRCCSVLPPRGRRVLNARYGLDGLERSRRAVAEDPGVSVRHVRDIEARLAPAQRASAPRSASSMPCRCAAALSTSAYLRWPARDSAARTPQRCTSWKSP